MFTFCKSSAVEDVYICARVNASSRIFCACIPPSSFLSPRETLGWSFSQAAAAAAAAAATAASQCSFVTKLKKTLFYHHNLFVFVR
jgi:hypothetical protein